MRLCALFPPPLPASNSKVITFRRIIKECLPRWGGNRSRRSRRTQRERQTEYTAISLDDYVFDVVVRSEKFLFRVVQEHVNRQLQELVHADDVLLGELEIEYLVEAQLRLEELEELLKQHFLWQGECDFFGELLSFERSYL